MGSRNARASVDRFHITPISNINQDTKGYTLSTQTVNTSIRNLILIAAGQSNITSIAPSVYAPSNPTKLDQLNIYNGAIYRAEDPILGCGWTRDNGVALYGTGNPMMPLADSFATSLFDRVIIVNVAVGGSLVAEWEPTGVYGDVIPVALRRLASLGIVEGANVTFTILWGQGEADTVAGTSQAAYTASLSSVIANSRTEGFTGPWFVAQETLNGVISLAVRAAQASVVDHSANIWAGPDADALVGAVCSGVDCRQGDLVHWSNAGRNSYAAGFKTKMALFGPPFA